MSRPSEKGEEKRSGAE